MIENPFLNKEFYEQLKSLPKNHPSREKTKLTILQSFAYPVLIWFFDAKRSLGSGRSTLMAYIYIELAMRGERVVLYDCSVMPFHGISDKRNNEHFIRLFMNIVEKEFPKELFEFNILDKTLIYKGRRP